MRKRKVFLAFLSMFLVSNCLLAQHGKVLDNLSMHSSILKSERKYAIYLPPDYDRSSRSYPVLYLLHGGGDDQTGWIQFGEVLHIADQAIKEGKSTPMIIVMPDASAGKRGFYNTIDGDWNYEDFFFKELMPYVEKKYRIKGEKRYRAVSGLSSGGGASFMYALHHPEIFASSAPLSALTGHSTIENLKEYLERNGEMTYSDEQLKDYFEKHNAVFLVDNASKEELSSVRWYIDCGDDDFLFEGNSLIHISMRKNNIPHEYRVRDGAHSWTYWRESLPEVLEFISMAFHQY
jgi:enterochelin esterase-like enzyme